MDLHGLTLRMDLDPADGPRSNTFTSASRGLEKQSATLVDSAHGNFHGRLKSGAAFRALGLAADAADPDGYGTLHRTRGRHLEELPILSRALLR